MYQEIAVAKGAEYDRLNQRMDKCQDNIEKLSDDIQRLQGIFFSKFDGFQFCSKIVIKLYQLTLFPSIVF